MAIVRTSMCSSEEFVTTSKYIELNVDVKMVKIRKGKEMHE